MQKFPKKLILIKFKVKYKRNCYLFAKAAFKEIAEAITFEIREEIDEEVPKKLPTMISKSFSKNSQRN